MKKKLKPIDMATYSRLKRKAHCFNKEHPELIGQLENVCDSLTIQLAEEKNKVDLLQSRERLMVDPGLHEEAKKTAWSQGFHEGQKDIEERLRKEKACFEKRHKFSEGKMLQNLNFGEMLDLWCKLAQDKTFGVDGRISVLVPDGVVVSALTLDQVRTYVRDMSVDKVVNSVIIGNKEKKGG